MRTFLLAALAGTMIGGAAIAQTPPAQAPTTMPPAGGAGRMMRGDTDGDGRISRAEATAEADARFARMDANGDGKLCGDEQMPRGRGMAAGADNGTSMPPPMPGGARGAGKGKGDTNGDACLSRDEFRARQMKRFDRLDANHDGFIDATEMQAMRDRMMNMRGQSGEMTPPPSPPNPGQ